MHEDVPSPVDQPTWVKGCIAEFTYAAYVVVLRSGTRGWWIDLELDIWRALATAVDKSTQWKSFMSLDSDDLDVSSQLDLDVLTDAVYRTALRHGLQGPFLDVELGLYRALQRVMSLYAELS